MKLHNTDSVYRPLVYINSDVHNATKYRDFVIAKGGIPVSTHLLYTTQVPHFNYVLLGKCDELWVFALSQSPEIEVAKKRHMRIRYFNADLKEVFDYA